MHQPCFGNIVFQFLFSSELLQESFSFEALVGRLYKKKFLLLMCSLDSALVYYEVGNCSPWAHHALTHPHSLTTHLHSYISPPLTLSSQLKSPYHSMYAFMAGFFLVMLFRMSTPSEQDQGG